ncbi:hypothetical protein PCC7418_1236 [Halothece sp. PCC 7418]|uniref:hypothetical protein n=1 Tax=Halothece sp. (strain PCC 7418) TaxID=65093 RepID=UPI0002A05FF5|nr:hypothetical protein [Halothece sp. PCC 7418]AFZ43438.1 hypothetical protein PCC7418_1236 [Halothece sp. PCC 7418]
MLNEEIPLYKKNALNQERASQRKWLDFANKIDGRKMRLPMDILDKAMALSKNDIEWLENELCLSLSDYDTDKTVEAAPLKSQDLNFWGKEELLELTKFVEQELGLPLRDYNPVEDSSPRFPSVKSSSKEEMSELVKAINIALQPKS